MVGSTGRSSILYVAASVLQKLAAVVLLPVYTHFLVPAEYGYYNLLVTLFMLAATAGTLGLDLGVVRYCHPSRNDDDEANRISRSPRVYFSAAAAAVVIGGVLAFVILSLSYPLYGHHLIPGIKFFPVVLMTLSAALLQPFILVFLSAMQAQERPGVYVFGSVGYFGVNSLISICLIGPLNLGVNGAIAALLVANCVVALFCGSVAVRSGLLGFDFSRSDLSEIVRYSLPLLPHSLMLQVTALASRVVVVQLVSVAAAGLLNLAMYAVSVVDAVQSAIHRAYMPLYFRLARERPAGWEQRIGDATSLMISANTIVAVLVSLFGYEVIVLATPVAYHSAASIVPILAVSMMAKALYYPSLTILLFNRVGSRPVMLISGLSGVVSIAISVPLVLSWGLMGAAVSQLLQRLLMAGLASMLARQYRIVRAPWRRIAISQMLGVVVMSVAWAVTVRLSGFDTVAFLVKLALFISIVFFVVVSERSVYGRYGRRVHAVTNK